MGACAVGVVTEVKGIVLSHHGGIRLQPGIKKTLICHKQKLKDNTPCRTQEQQWKSKLLGVKRAELNHLRKLSLINQA